MTEYLLTKEDIEKYGLVYEPNESLCKLFNTGIHYDCNYYKDRSWTHRTSPTIDNECKKMICETINLKFPPNWQKRVHSVFVLPIEPMDGQGVMCRRIYIKGC